MAKFGEGAIEFSALEGGKTSVPLAALQAFRGAFRGALLQAGDAGYDDARLVWNGMFDRRPALIARPTGPADVMAAVRLAADHGLLVSVKGGGHNIAGLAVAEGGLVIDLSALRGVWVDAAARRVRAQAGCTLGDVDRETQAYGLATVLGFVSLTGIAGLTTGGGFGYLTRRFGWTSDNVLSMDVVTAEGRHLRASETENPDLFWCLRGGSGNFGVVTSFEYQLHPVGPEVVGGAVAWHGDDAHQVLRFFKEIAAAAPREMTCVAMLRLAPPAPWLPPAIHGKPMVGVFICHTGPLDEAEKAVAPIKAFGKPVADILVRRPYAQVQSLLDATQPRGRRYYWKAEYLPRVEEAAIDTLVARAASIPSPHSAIALFQLEGAVNELPMDHSPVGNRDAAWVLNIPSAWEQPADDAANIAWTRGTWEAIRPFSTGGVYVNFLTEEEGRERTVAAYRSTLDRLATLKRQLDPRNLFRHTKNVV